MAAGLVMEINPSTKGKDAPLDLRPQWMYDQVEAKSELDFVLDLRREHGRHRHRPPIATPPLSPTVAHAKPKPHAHADPGQATPSPSRR